MLSSVRPYVVLFLSGVRAIYVLIRDLLFWHAADHPQSDGEGPETLIWAPLRGKYLYDGDIQGDNLIFTAHVVDITNNSPIVHAEVEAWHNHPTGAWYSNFDYQFRGRFLTNEQGSIEIHTKKPATLLIEPMHKMVCFFRKLLGKSQLPIEQVAKRPAHIHWRISAPGYKTLYTQTYFDQDTYAFDIDMMRNHNAMIMKERRNTTLKVSLIQDTKQPHEWTGSFTFMLQRA